MRLTEAQIAETREAAAKWQHPDGRPNAEQMARALGLAASTVKSRLKAVERASTPVDGASTPPLDQFSTYEEIHGRPKPVVRVKAMSSERSEEPVYRVLAIGDHHDKPGRDKDRAIWIGRHAAETKPDAIVSIGDWASLDSLSVHEAPGSQADGDRPSFHQELDSLDASLSAFHRHLPVGQIPIFHTHGNHEHRAWRSANRQPKQCGDMPIRLDGVFARYRWHTLPFGEFLDMYGVDFVHCPLNVMGREMGGMNVERNIGNNSLRSTVFGHTHRGNLMNVTKIGQHRRITVVNLGTSMPYGVVEKYNGLSMTGWTYGVWELRIQGGNIIGWKFIDMLELSELYAD